MPGQVNSDDLQVAGGDSVKPRLDFPLSNWATINAVSGATVASPHTQTGATATCVAALALTAAFTGLFEYSVRVSFSDGTTAGTVTHNLVTKQGAGNGAVSGGVAAIKSGGGAASVAIAAGATVNGQILNVDAAGGNGLQFEAANIGGTGVVQHTDITATLTGLLTANAIGADNFSFYSIADAVASTSLVKTPFTLGKPVLFALLMTSTAAHVITYDSLSFMVRELPVA